MPVRPHARVRTIPRRGGVVVPVLLAGLVAGAALGGCARNDGGSRSAPAPEPLAAPLSVVSSVDLDPGYLADAVTVGADGAAHLLMAGLSGSAIDVASLATVVGGEVVAWQPVPGPGTGGPHAMWTTPDGAVWIGGSASPYRAFESSLVTRVDAAGASSTVVSGPVPPPYAGTVAVASAEGATLAFARSPSDGWTVDEGDQPGVLRVVLVDPGSATVTAEASLDLGPGALTVHDGLIDGAGRLVLLVGRSPAVPEPDTGEVGRTQFVEVFVVRFEPGLVDSEVLEVGRAVRFTTAMALLPSGDLRLAYQPGERPETRFARIPVDADEVVPGASLDGVRPRLLVPVAGDWSYLVGTVGGPSGSHQLIPVAVRSDDEVGDPVDLPDGCAIGGWAPAPTGVVLTSSCAGPTPDEAFTRVTALG